MRPVLPAKNVKYSRPLYEYEQDILTIAAEIARRRYADDVSEELDEQMVEWAQRLTNSYSHLKKALIIEEDNQ
jgi:hypothetical protein